MRAIAALFLALTATAALGGEVYGWRDASGKMHYSDAPPPGVDAKKLRSGTPADPSSSRGGPQRSLAEQELDFRKRRTQSEQAREQSDKEKAEDDVRRRDCDQARAQLQALESGQRMTRFNEKGETVYMGDEERAQAIERTRQQIGQVCK